ncbi:DUF1573 domain-containing protein [Bacteroidota bacterium]
MYRFIFFFLFAISINTGLKAQVRKTKIEFEKTTHDFQTFNEEDGSVSYSFNFTNTGNYPLIITQVTSSCGCTTPNWTKFPVQPGKKGFVKATYNPLRRPGVFNKTIMVRGNFDPSILKLWIKGNVIPKVQSVEEKYRMNFGPLRMKTNHLSFSNMLNTRLISKMMTVYNNSDKEIKVEFVQVPAHIKIKVVPELLKPKTEGVFIVEYDPVIKNDYGFIVDQLKLKVDNKVYDDMMFAVSATIAEDFSSLSAQQRLDAPSIKLDTVVFNFDTINQGDIIRYDFNFKNTGKNPLIIRKLKSSCGCTVTSPEKKIIPGGESSKITVVFNSTDKKGRQYYNINLITNDPKNSSINLKVTGMVKLP